MLLFFFILTLFLLLCSIVILVLCFKRLNFLFDTLEIAQKQTEESLDIIDDCYKKIVTIAETPVLYDDPTVRNLLQEIKNTKQAVLLIANKLIEFTNIVDEKEKQEVTQ